MKRYFTTVLFVTIFSVTKSQSIVRFADSIRVAYHIPELAFAVVSADTVFECHTIGVQRANNSFPARPGDRFHIGSNTKAITAFLAALLVENGTIKWNTRFLDLFPELKPESKKAYYPVTLENLLTFRGKLPAYTYTFDRPRQKEITGDNDHQRFLLAKYFLSQRPMKEQNGLTPSNADYILAGLMLEKATGQSFKELVTDFGKTQGIDFGFDYPNLADTLQPWGHDSNLQPQPPSGNYKLNWLLSAGNINVSLAGYIKFIRLQLAGLKGNSPLLPKETFNRLLFGLPVFAYGWFNKADPGTQHTIAFNEGNAGAFITRVTILKEADRAYIIFTNAATAATAEGVTVLQHYLEAKYGR